MAARLKRKKDVGLVHGVVDQLDSEGIQRLWEWLDKQDRYTVEQFGIGIVGIGALFFAYGQITTPTLKILVALIGLGGSVTLWVHMFAAHQERDAIESVLRCIPTNSTFFKAWDQAMRWRNRGRLNRSYLYHPSSRLMTYFMGLVSWAWITIAFYRVSVALASGQFGTNSKVFPRTETGFSSLWWASLGVIVFVALLVFNRKRRDFKKYKRE